MDYRFLSVARIVENWFKKGKLNKAFLHFFAKFNSSLYLKKSTILIRNYKVINESIYLIPEYV